MTTSFDEDMIPILPAIWYALHLPKTRFDVLDLSLLALRESMRESSRHQILLVPADLLNDHTLLRLVVRDADPTLILCPEDQLEAANEASVAIGFTLPPVAVNEFSQQTLEAHWKAMSDHWRADWPEGVTLDPTAPTWTTEVSKQGSTLSYRRLMRNLGLAAPQLDDAEEPCASARLLIERRVWANAWANLEDREVAPEELEAQLPAAVAAARQLRLPLTLSAPGVAPRYRRFVRELHAATTGLDEGNAAATDTIAPEPRAGDVGPVVDLPEVLSLMVAHRAAGDDSMGVVLSDPIPDAAFIALADLERHWVHGVEPAKEKRLRERLDATMSSFWTASMIGAVNSATRLDAFTNFPLGLLRMPGHTAPLAALLPIAYRPINPLTRALQMEFTPDRVVDLSQGMHVLVVECIPDTDPVGAESLRSWLYAAEHLTDEARSVTLEVVSVSNKRDLAAAVAAHRPDVLVISAHGFHDVGSNVAGLVIGTEPSVGNDLGPMPPMVILSACHSGPRGAGPVSVSDLLIRAGASAVLSTLVPVRVQHIFTFMFRFLVYISETIGGVEDHASVLDLWHRVQTNTVIIDITHGNPRLNAWSSSDADGRPPLVEFMASRSRGRLRPQHLYADAEAVLLEIAAERGQDTTARGWLRSPGYVPESMMYTFVGDPSAIRLQSPRLLQANPREP